MDKGKRAKKQVSASRILYWTAGVLLVATLLSMHLVGGLYAKYTTSDSASDSARVAAGLPTIELLEHEAELKSGEYVLNGTEVAANVYEKVIPGVDIPKDSFVRLTGDSEVSYELYMKAEGTGIPSTVTYAIDTSVWAPVSGQSGVYKYTGEIISGQPIYILKDNQLTVSEHYVGSGGFSLAFSAWIEQVD